MQITREELLTYWKAERLPVELLYVFSPIALLLFFVELAMPPEQHRLPLGISIGIASLICCMLALIGLRMTATSKEKEIERERERPYYRMLKRWERYSGRTLFDFPLHPLKYEWVWAIDRLAEFVADIESTQIQREKIADSVMSNIGRVSERKIQALIKKLNKIDALIEKLEGEYLEAWQLMTNHDGFGIGEGILHGPEWEDPSEFRRRFLNREAIQCWGCEAS